MNSKGHFFLSILKSSFRIAGCVAMLASGQIVVFVVLIGLAEILGIAEEFMDKR